MPDAPSLCNHLLIAMPGLTDPNFFHTVTYLCEHDEDGAMGLVINRPLEMRLGDVFAHTQIEPGDPFVADRPVFQGGPVQPERGFVLHQPLGDWQATLRVTDEIGVTASQDILAAMAAGQGPQRALVALGYAGWGPGQLEQEMADNAWLNGPADPRILFDTPVERRWEAAAALLGVDLKLLSNDTGHA
ncbi:YqgE/AlgH family protein [Thiohalobacter sp. IOR34]|uniref:YqgE/AlgH family protein n=1 Tax=Thiohalobacter sp. IOR34 TaxID=3057176 RepID=UPI0025B101C9|nr:YqgE/AlgH family protein [Thiohalobacter sp. IOR34]WJW75785.1 YqgE/AlgH family protein [Thiohalobacter sp. IOR34]